MINQRKDIVRFSAFAMILIFMFVSCQSTSCKSADNGNSKTFSKTDNEKNGKSTDKANEITYDKPEKIINDVYWFEDIQRQIEVAKDEGKKLVNYVANSILKNEFKPDEVPDKFRFNTRTFLVFLSVGNAKEAARVFIASGDGLINACRNAVAIYFKNSEAEFSPKFVKLDIVTEVRFVKNLDFDERVSLDRDFEGLAFHKDSKIAFLPDELISYHIVSNKRKITARKIKMYLAKTTTLVDKKIKEEAFMEIMREKVTPVYRFKTASFFSDGSNTYKLFKNFRLFKNYSAEDLLETAKQAAKYLMGIVLKDGKFKYIYLPGNDTDTSKYNILRHAGTVYSMLEVYEMTRDAELLKSAKQALAWLVSRIISLKDKPNLACLVDKNGYVKLGGNGLATIAISKYIELTGDRQYQGKMIKLCRWIQSTQTNNGKFYKHKIKFSNGEIQSHISLYYPGEAILALLRIHRIVPEESWLETAEKGAQYLIKVRDANTPILELSPDHWLLYSLNELYRHRKKKLFIQHSKNIVEAILSKQILKSEQLDWIGGFVPPPKSGACATRNEGLLSAYKLFRDYDDKEFAKKILDAIRLGIGYQISTQFRPESSMYFMYPQKAIGGFGASGQNFQIQIDYVQHNISCILGLYKLIKSK